MKSIPNCRSAAVSAAGFTTAVGARLTCLTPRLRFVMFLPAFLLFLRLAPPAQAYPPAPHHVVYGLIRDDYGTPLLNPQTQVVLVTPGGVQIATTISPGLAPGVNYQLEVPMDSGVTADPYQSTALQTAAQFKMYVVVGSVTNLPIQMVGSFASLGQPAQQTRIDLTIGVDSNGDGIPDSWELAYLAALGSNLPLSSLNANLILSPDGLTLLQEYLAGYYPYDPSATFTLRLVSVNGGSPILEFTAITGRSYSIFGSSDLHTWTPLSFSIPAEGNGGPTHSYYFASDVRTLQVQALQPGSTSRPTLNFTHSGNQVIFSWPTNAAGFSLVSSPSLPASTWTPIAATPQVVGSQFVLSNTMAGAKQFFRLAHPQVNFFRLGLQ